MLQFWARLSRFEHILRHWPASGNKSWKISHHYNHVSGTLHFHTRVSRSHPQNPSVPNKSVTSTHIRQFYKNKWLTHKSVSSAKIRHFYTNLSVINNSTINIQIRHFHTNPSLPHKSITSSRHWFLTFYDFCGFFFWCGSDLSIQN